MPARAPTRAGPAARVARAPRADGDHRDEGSAARGRRSAHADHAAARVAPGRRPAPAPVPDPYSTTSHERSRGVAGRLPRRGLRERHVVAGAVGHPSQGGAPRRRLRSRAGHHAALAGLSGGHRRARARRVPRRGGGRGQCGSRTGARAGPLRPSAVRLPGSAVGGPRCLLRARAAVRLRWCGTAPHVPPLAAAAGPGGPQRGRAAADGEPRTAGPRDPRSRRLRVAQWAPARGGATAAPRGGRRPRCGRAESGRDRAPTPARARGAR